MAEVAGRLRGWLCRDADQYVSHDFRAAEESLPKGEHFGVRQPTRRPEKRIVQDDAPIVDINENRVMTGWRVVLEAMIQDRANPGIPAELQRLQRMTRLDGHSSEAAPQCVLSHEVGSRRETAEPVLFPNRLPYLRLRDLLAERTIDHAKAGCAAVPVSPRIRLSLVWYDCVQLRARAHL